VRKKAPIPKKRLNLRKLPSLYLGYDVEARHTGRRHKRRTACDVCNLTVCTIRDKRNFAVSDLQAGRGRKGNSDRRLQKRAVISIA
jgi:hypothetical protein